MDATVSARFFRVSDKPATVPDFDNLLLGQMGKPVAAREQDLTGTGVWLRVEHCEQEGPYVSGQFCRKQMENIPPQAGPDGLTPILLEEGQGLGHLCAFRYHRPTRILLLQQNVQSASSLRIAMYLACLESTALYAFIPVLREDALERSRTGRFAVSQSGLRRLPI